MGYFLKIYNDMGMSATNVIPHSFESSAKRKNKSPVIRVLVFFLSSFLNTKMNVRIINRKDRISSLLFTLATTSVCIGCTRNSKVVKNAISLGLMNFNSAYLNMYSLNSQSNTTADH